MTLIKTFRNLLLVLAVVLTLTWWLAPLGGIESVEGAEGLIRSWGAWGVAGSIGLMILHSFVPFPAEILALANGMLYGPLGGALITWIGAMLGASVAFGLARAFGRPFVLRVLPERHRRALAHWSDTQGALVLLAARLVPLIAFNLINYVAALTHVSWWTFLWTTSLGILPATIALAVLGQNVLEMSWCVWLLAAALTVLGGLALRYWLGPVLREGEFAEQRWEARR